jgi:hypothetical protein
MRHKGILGSEPITPPFLPSALDGGEWSVPCPCRFTPGTHWLGGSSRYSDWLQAVRPKDRNSSPGRVKNFLFYTSSRLALRPTQPPIQWTPGALSPGMKLTTHLQPVLRSRKRGSIHPLPICLHGVVLN